MSELLHDHHFWVLISLVILIALVWKPAARSITSALDERAVRIRNELDEARKLRDEAEQLLADYRRQEREAAAEAEAIVTHARQEAERLAAQAARDLDQSLARRQRLAEERIAQAEARATAEVRGGGGRYRDRRGARGHRLRDRSTPRRRADRLRDRRPAAAVALRRGTAASDLAPGPSVFRTDRAGLDQAAPVLRARPRAVCRCRAVRACGNRYASRHAAGHQSAEPVQRDGRRSCQPGSGP